MSALTWAWGKMLGKFFMLFFLSADLFQNYFFKKFFQEHYQSQAVWIQIKTDILSVLIWVQTVCKGYQLMTKATASKERVKIQYFEYLEK